MWYIVALIIASVDFAPKRWPPTKSPVWSIVRIGTSSSPNESGCALPNTKRCNRNGRKSNSQSKTLFVLLFRERKLFQLHVDTLKAATLQDRIDQPQMMLPSMVERIDKSVPGSAVMILGIDNADYSMTDSTAN
jgi:hypothetical protein